ncbi:MAG: TetR/AcrR family transcriptional regulator [Deltaproteobacteria bacterium]|nr:TetR/AcrR family transcriptional regulator [Deltaproteobacteria bacterium]MDQ3295344.1 QsdR family transcriptional regulator [Myxococcota bacterium]
MIDAAPRGGKRARIPTPPRNTPLSRLLDVTQPAAASRVTALDALELATQKWLAGERLDIGRLADELKIGRATLFRWVGSKEQLYGEVISAAFGATLAWAIRRGTGTGAAYLTSVTDHLLRALVASQPLRRFVRHDAELALRIVMSSSSPVEHRVVTAVRELIDAEVTAGQLVPAMDTGSLAYVIVRIAESFLYRDVISGEAPDVDTATRAIGLLFTAQAAQKPVRKRVR